MSKENSKEVNKFQCEECKFKSSSKLMLERHMNGIHGIIQVESKKSIGTKGSVPDIHFILDFFRLFGR